MYKITVPVMFDREYFNKETTLSELRRMKADRVGLIVERDLDYKFSSPQTLKKLSDMIEYFKSNGFEVLVWIGETFGHATDVVDDNVPYTRMRYFNVGDRSPICPLDPDFQKDFCDWIVEVAKCGAEMILLDDDYRIGGRHIGLACCCKLHMAALKKELGESLTEDEFKEKAFDGGKNRYRDAWIKVCADTMKNFSLALRNALDAVNPDIRLGACCAPCSWDSDGSDAIEIAKILAGKTRPFLRMCGAPYWANYDKSLGDAVEIARIQAAWCKEEDIEIFSEGDTYPRPRFATPASWLSCFDMILRASGETEGILNYALDYVSHANYETGYIDFHVRNEELYREIDRIFMGKTSIGVKPYIAMRILEDRQLDIMDGGSLFVIQDNLSYSAIRMTVRTSLPVTYEPGAVNVVFGEHARYIDRNELKNGSIIDLAAAQILMDRGVDVGIENIIEVLSCSSKGFSTMPCEYYLKEEQYTRLSYLGRQNVVYKSGVNVVTKFIQEEEYDGVGEYENADGFKFVILPVTAEQAPQGFFDTYARRQQLLRSIEWLTGRKMPIEINGKYPMLYMLIKEDDNGISVGLWNLFDDKIEKLSLMINVEYENIEFVNCSGHMEVEELVLDSVLYPYEFAAIEIKRR